MIVITCSNLDDNAKLLKAKWPNNNAILLSVNDLTSQGWEVCFEDFSRSKFVAEEKVWPVTDIEGVVNLLPFIAPFELFKIVEEDRKYVASELNAFLFYFFSKFSCPFLNNPSMFNLSGPFIKQEEWIINCRKTGLLVYPQKENNKQFYQSFNATHSISYINGIVYGDRSDNYERRMKHIAEITGLNHFTLHLKEEEGQEYFHSVSTYPTINNEEALSRLINYFQN